MPKYIVIRPWFGVQEGDEVDLKDLHPSLKANVLLKKEAAKLTPATPEATSDTGARRGRPPGGVSSSAE